MFAARYWIAVWVVAIAMPFATAQTGESDPRLASFDRLMESFVKDNQAPGAALAVAKDGRLAYARGFGHSDERQKLPVEPTTRFRIASVSKPITAVAILKLIEQGKFELDDPVRPLLGIRKQGQEDPRWAKVTVRQLLQHTGGWDRAKSFDPMFRPLEVAKEVGSSSPAPAKAVVQYMLRRPFDFEPGERFAYSNFGYCVLGRVIEHATGKEYEGYVRDEILKPLGIMSMSIGTTSKSAKGETSYFDPKKRMGSSVFTPRTSVPLPYGAWHLEAMDAHGGWIASAPDLVRFAVEFNAPDKCRLLRPSSIQAMFARPQGIEARGSEGKPNPVYYGCGWQVRETGNGVNTWHTGALDGTASLLVRRHDGLTWAVLFNAKENPRGEYLAGKIDPLIHRAADEVKEWPTRDMIQGEN
ncbi:MAG: beta-lactamase family protein [Gemmataceae bacterium]|nr:beta-lactamase family protein [Gemmataceae bacterium]